MPRSTPLLLNLLASFWNALGGPLRRGLAWLVNAKFIHGVAGVIIDGQGRVLLLKHRFWKQQPWGLPGGMARKGETLAATLRRELREETGLEVRPSRLLQVNIHRDRLSTFILLAECAGVPEVKSAEIMEARFWDLAALPENLLPAHRELLQGIPAMRDGGGLPLEG